MALKKKKNVEVSETKESAVQGEEKLVDAITGKPFAEAPKKRQGDGVLSREVPSGFNG